MATLLSLPTDVLRCHIFTEKSLDKLSLAISSLVCKKIRVLVPVDKRKVSLRDVTGEDKHSQIFYCRPENGYTWNFIREYAAEQDHLEMLQWATANCPPWNDRTYCLPRVPVEDGEWHPLCKWIVPLCKYPAFYGHLEIIQWLRANGCPWDEQTCRQAALGGQVGLLQWLRANDCPWDEQTCRYAIMNDHLETLQWLRANGCPWDKEDCLRHAKAYRHKHIVEWITQQID